MLSNWIAAFLVAISAGTTTYGQKDDHGLQGAVLFEPADIRPYDNWGEAKEGIAFLCLFWGRMVAHYAAQQDRLEPRC
jgi:hypothetical protein